MVLEEFTGTTESYDYNKSLIEKSSSFFKSLFSKDNKEIEESEINLFGSIDLTSFFRPDYSLILKTDNIFIKDTDENFVGNGRMNFTITD